MNAADLHKLPQFIDGSGDGMWPIESGTVETAACRYVRLADVLDLLKQTTAYVVPICPGCKNEIDLDVCQCGEYIQQHDCHVGHTPVPMGCTCGYVQQHPRPFQ